MPQLDFTTYLSQIFWLIFFFGLLYFTLSRYVLHHMEEVIEGRKKKIALDIEEANAAKKTAEEIMYHCSIALHEAYNKADAVFLASKQNVQSEKEKKLKALEIMLGKKLEEAEMKALAFKTSYNMQFLPKIAQISHTIFLTFFGNQSIISFSEIEEKVKETLSDSGRNHDVSYK